jgi:amino-acid N-acetyltransferase
MDPFNIDTFRSAAPYIYAHQGRVFVVTISRETAASGKLSELVQDLALLHTLGIKLILVYAAANELVAGKQCVDAKRMQSLQAEIAAQRTQLESLFSAGLINTPMAGMKLRVVSGNFIHAKPAGIIAGVDSQHYGVVRRVDSDAIQAQLAANNIVLLSPTAYSPSGEYFYIDALNVAAAVAASVPADKLIVMMDEKTLQASRGQRLKHLNLNQAQTLLRRRKSISSVLRRYITLAIETCLNQVPRVHLLSTTVRGALLHELFSHAGCGTLISADDYDDIRPASIEDVGGIMSLIKPLQESGSLVGRSEEQIERDIHSYDVIERDGFVIACAALQQIDDSVYAEVACFAVHPDFQKEGHGSRLITHIEQKAAASGLQHVMVLTTKALHWFHEQGYQTQSIKNLPIAKQKTYNSQRNSRILIKSIV